MVMVPMKQFQTTQGSDVSYGSTSRILIELYTKSLHRILLLYLLKVFPPFYWVLKKEKERKRNRKERNRGGLVSTLVLKFRLNLCLISSDAACFPSSTLHLVAGLHWPTLVVVGLR